MPIKLFRFSQRLRRRNLVWVIMVFMAATIFLFSSCNSDMDRASEEMPLLYPAPPSVPLNLEEGYVLNQLTGDSIQLLLSSTGDTLRTGVPIQVSGKVVPAGKASRSLTFQTDGSQVVPAHLNVHPIPKDPYIVQVNVDSLKTFSPSAESSSFVLLGPNRDTIPTGIPVPVTGEVVPCIQPQPVKALPLRMKDNASLNLKYLDVDQGMNASWVISILEDSRGNLWFGTVLGGASKYDGVSFTHYTEEEGLSRTVVSMLEDSHGNLWFGTGDDGVIMFDGETFTHYSEKEGFPGKAVYCMLEDRHGNLWFGNEGGGVCMFDGVSFVHYTVKEGLASNDVRSMLEDSKGDLWFGHPGSGVSRYDGNTFTHITSRDGLASYVNCIMEDRDSNIWFGAGGEGATMYNGESFTHFIEREGFFSHMMIVSILEDHHGDIYFGTMGGGVSKFDGHAFTQITEEEGLSDNTVYTMLEDSHGNIWFGTEGGGVCFYQSGAFSGTTTREGLSSNEVTSILEDREGDLWFGTKDQGLNRYDGETFTHFSYGKKIIPSSDDKHILYVDYIESGLLDRQGNLWFGTYGAGIGRYSNKTITYLTEQEGLSSDFISSILEDRQGNLWFGTDGGGVCMFDGLTFTHLTEDEGLTDGTVFSMMEDNQGHLWFGTYSGAYRYNGETLTLFSEKEGLSNNIVLSILEDSRGYIWFGTAFGGASVYHDGSFTYLTEKEGLSNNMVYSILEDPDHNVWLGTGLGLNHLVFDREDTTRGTFNIPIIQTYGTQDGLTSNDFYSNSAFLDSNNRMWWGTDKGLIMLDMNRFKIPSEPPVVQLDHIEINDQFIDFRHMEEMNRRNLKFSGVAGFYNYPLNLKLPYHQNHLAFHFSAIDWSAQEKIRYSFTMEGLDNSWSLPSESALAEYRQLPFGTYTFKVRAMSLAQKWSEPFEYTFVISPPWWHTWVARAGYVIVAILIVFAYVRRRTAKLKQRQKELEMEVKRATRKITEQKEEVEAQKEEIEAQRDEIEAQRDEVESQRDLVITQKNAIVDSISYARRIQTAMLPPEAYVTELLNENFILYKPRDIVSGDFYWIKQVNQYIVLLAADCTGHGVPGALMSMLGISHLNEIVQRKEITQANQILNELRKQIKFSLRQHGHPDEAKDGIDMALCVLDLRNMTMQYSGANNPLYLISDVEDVPELKEIKADRMPIGFYEGKDKSFANHEIQLKIGDTFYIFSDGFMDQKGGKDNKKFMSKSFKKLLLEIHDKPMYEQKDILEKTLKDWMGANAQVDDILVIGVRV